MQKLSSGQKRVLWDEKDENKTNIKIWFELHNEFPKNQQLHYIGKTSRTKPYQRRQER